MLEHRESRRRERRKIGYLLWRRAITVAVVAVVIVGLSEGVSTLAKGQQTSGDTCTASQLSNEEASAQQGQSTTLPVSTALNSSILEEAAIGSLGPSVAIAFESTFDLWSLNLPTCSVTLQNVGVAFALSSNLGKASATVMENPSMTEAFSVNVSAPRAVATLYAEWVGYDYYYLSGIQNEMFYFEPKVSDPYGCGSAEYCEVDQWVGMTNDLYGGGGGGNYGIAQTGTGESITIVWGIASYQYFAWYEWFEPGGNGYTSCFSVSPGDEIIPTVWYSGNYNYHMTLNDFTKSQACSESKTFNAMGTPNYVNYIVEDPVCCGSNPGYNPVIPDFGSPLFWDVVSPANGAQIAYPFWNTNNPTGHGNMAINPDISDSSAPGCYDSYCFGVVWSA